MPALPASPAASPSAPASSDAGSGWALERAADGCGPVAGAADWRAAPRRCAAEGAAVCRADGCIAPARPAAATGTPPVPRRRRCLPPVAARGLASPPAAAASAGPDGASLRPAGRHVPSLRAAASGAPPSEPGARRVPTAPTRPGTGRAAAAAAGAAEACASRLCRSRARTWSSSVHRARSSAATDTWSSRVSANARAHAGAMRGRGEEWLAAPARAVAALGRWPLLDRADGAAAGAAIRWLAARRRLCADKDRCLASASPAA